ncbi:MAG: hypothetical protein J7K75_05115 [Desulfuromonas sp.]|nr:hypothetical protein [Desulfuromonas sp.]
MNQDQGRGFRPAADTLSLQRPKESEQRNGFENQPSGGRSPTDDESFSVLLHLGGKSPFRSTEFSLFLGYGIE